MPHELIAWKVLDFKKKSNIIKLVIDYQLKAKGKIIIRTSLRESL